ncbi:MAG: AAA family ATPase [Phototrophicaceae bacterium]
MFSFFNDTIKLIMSLNMEYSKNMITKFSTINGVARLKNIHAHTLDLKPLNLIYGENGRGKSTLTCILRSLQNNDSNAILQRKTKNFDNSQFIEIHTEGNKHIFKNGKWNQNFINVEIFDSQFIFDNVVAGNHTNYEHNRRLVNVVLGQENIELGNKISELDTTITTQNKNKREQEAVINRHIISNNLNLKDFLKLEKDEDIEARIQQIEGMIEAVNEKSNILSQDNFFIINLPEIPIKNITALLSKTLESLEDNAEKIIEDHLKKHNVTEGWLQLGTLDLDEECPFCGQNIKGISIIQIYQSFFSNIYKELKEEIKNFINEFDNKIMSKDVISELTNNIKLNEKLLPFWKSHLDVHLLDEDTENINNIFTNLKAQISKLLHQKFHSPLDMMIISDEIQILIEEYDKILLRLKQYNDLVQIENQKIEEKKLSLDTSSLENLEIDLNLAKDTNTRYRDDINKICKIYDVLIQDLASNKALKKDLQEKLRLQASHLTQFSEDVNQYLMLFGGDFSISMGSELSYQGKKPKIDWEIGLDNVTIGAEEAFQYGLSEGDKSTLALSFFLARLKHKDLSKSVIIFDDPISSLDHDRRAQTRDELLSLCTQAKQVIILSHDKYFMRDIWQHNETDNSQIKTLKIEPEKGYSVISKWDIEEATKNQFLKELDKLIKYLDGEGNLKDVARAIRVTLEEYFKTNYPKYFPSHNSLGEIRNTINSQCNDVNQKDKKLQMFANDLDNLGKINKFTRTHSHGNATDELTYNMVKSYVNMTLDFLGKHMEI